MIKIKRGATVINLPLSKIAEGLNNECIFRGDWIRNLKKSGGMPI